MKETRLDELIVQVNRLGFKDLTKIQKKTFPILLNKVNTLIISPTGTGKTEAAILPIFYLVSKDKERKNPRILYITPLRALNRDLFRRIKSYTDYFGLNVDVRHGDTSTSRRRMIQEEPPDLLISTPETLSILLALPKFIKKLENIEWVIVDEVHELINSKRGVHLAFSLERLEKISPRFVRIGLSATIGSPDKAKKFLFGVKRKGAVVIDNVSREYLFENKFVDGELTNIAEVAIENVLEQIKGNRSTIIFTNTRQTAEYLAALIKAKNPEILIEVHHGSLSKESREQAEKELREGIAKVVVTTSSLEMGIDIGAVSLVIQIDSPRQAVKLLQRVGRSEHKVGGIAKGLILNNSIDDHIETAAICKLIEKGELEEPVLHYCALDVLAHQIVGLALVYKAIKSEEIIRMAKETIFYTELNSENIIEIINILSEIKAVRFDGDTVYRGSKCFTYYFGNVSMIPENLHYSVINAVNNMRVGNVDQLFVREALEQERPFVLRGTAWNVLSIDDVKQTVKVEPKNIPESEIPYWMGELIPVDQKTAVLVGKIRRNYKRENICQEAKKIFEETNDQIGMIPDDKHLVIEKKIGDSTYVIHSCCGTKINNTLGTLLSTVLTSKLGYIVEYTYDPYRIIISGGEVLTPEIVKETLTGQFNLREILEVAVRDSSLMKTREWHIGKRFGIIPKGIAYDGRFSSFILKRYFITPLYSEVLNEIFTDKFDIDNANKILNDIREGKIDVLIKNGKDFSSLAKIGFRYKSKSATTAYDVSITILNTIKERLENRKHKFLCLSCGKWERTILTKEVTEPIYCQRCRSRLITIISSWNETARDIIKKKIQNKKLSKEEFDEYKKLWKTSSLIQNYGKKAVYVLSGYGIGPSNAVRILDKKASEEELLREIYRAEKVFIRTRPFWGD